MMVRADRKFGSTRTANLSSIPEERDHGAINETINETVRHPQMFFFSNFFLVYFLITEIAPAVLRQLQIQHACSISWTREQSLLCFDSADKHILDDIV